MKLILMPHKKMCVAIQRLNEINHHITKSEWSYSVAAGFAAGGGEVGAAGGMTADELFPAESVL
jgi:hypothetical protein